MQQISVTGGGIRLGQLLKLANLVETGGEARSLLDEGRVRVNGEVETRRGAQLHIGDVIELDGARITLVTSG